MVPPAPAILEGMGGRSQAQVGYMAPVFTVVAGGEFRPASVVRYLVVEEAGSAEEIVRGQEEFQGRLLAGKGEFTAPETPPEGGSGFGGQLINGEVRRFQVQGGG